MLLHFTFVPGDLVRLPWQRRHGVRRPMRGESRLKRRWPSLLRAASGRPLWGSGFALKREEEEEGNLFWNHVWKSAEQNFKIINRCSCCPLLELLQQYNPETARWGYAEKGEDKIYRRDNLGVGHGAFTGGIFNGYGFKKLIWFKQSKQKNSRKEDKQKRSLHRCIKLEMFSHFWLENKKWQ